MSNKIPERLTNYTAYKNGGEYLGTVDVELPSIEALTDTIKGAGIAGEIDSPTLGHFASMSVKLNWRTVGTSLISLSIPKSHQLDFRGSQQILNAGTGEYEHQAVKVSVRAMPKVTELGKLEVGATTDSSNELEVSYIKIDIGGKNMLEIDKLNFICVIDGVDVLEEVRKNLGM